MTKVPMKRDLGQSGQAQIKGGDCLTSSSTIYSQPLTWGIDFVQVLGSDMSG